MDRAAHPHSSAKSVLIEVVELQADGVGARAF
jgi:hypothetical protein